MPTLLDHLRSARPLATPVTELWLKMGDGSGIPGPDSMHNQMRRLRREGHVITDLQIEREGQKVWAWRLDHDKELGY